MNRVLYIANSGTIGGGDRVLFDLITHIDRTRFTPTLLAPARGSVVNWAEANGVECSIVPDTDRNGRLGMLRRAASIARLVRRRGIRLIHAGAPTCYRGAGLAGMLTGAARVCHLGFPPWPGELEWSFRFGPEAVIACHQKQADDVRSRVNAIQPRSRVLAVSNGVEIGAYGPAPQPNGRWRAGARHVILIVGHLSEVKGYPTFLHAAARVAARVEGCRFVALGGETTTPGYQKVLEAMASDLGIGSNLQFLGWRDDVPDVLRAVDLMVLPSQAEGLSLAILEAMASGLPVVATDVGGTSEAVVDGETGLLIPPDDPEALAETIVRMLTTPGLAEQMGRAGRSRAASMFSLDRVVSSVEALYDDLLASRN